MTSLPEQIKKESANKIIEIAKNMIDGKINLAAGSRKIETYRYQTDYSDDELFDIFMLVADDTDHIPLDEEVREKWNKDALKKLDSELEEYIKVMKPDMLDACEAIVEKYSTQT
ncbi:MAG TPA: hypothetical protein VM077_02025 [Candidatus Limnocylindrales bacterium]|nr:hypothetical protein [Candidatus Limnocylindrales bacterium]